MGWPVKDSTESPTNFASSAKFGRRFEIASALIASEITRVVSVITTPTLTA